jgi:hypothetical protein
MLFSAISYGNLSNMAQNFNANVFSVANNMKSGFDYDAFNLAGKPASIKSGKNA